jgi:hypothetical protein
MADEKKGPGPKTEDTRRDEDVSAQQNTAGANAAVEDMRGRVFGDNTSSTGGANNPGQHGRDGGEINTAAAGSVSTNNPAPDEAVAENEAGAETQRQILDEQNENKNEDTASAKPKTL